MALWGRKGPLTTSAGQRNPLLFRDPTEKTLGHRERIPIPLPFPYDLALDWGGVCMCVWGWSDGMDSLSFGNVLCCSEGDSRFLSFSSYFLIKVRAI